MTTELRAPSAADAEPLARSRPAALVRAGTAPAAVRPRSVFVITSVSEAIQGREERPGSLRRLRLLAMTGSSNADRPEAGAELAMTSDERRRLV
jgi:hypothetical protein